MLVENLSPEKEFWKARIWLWLGFFTVVFSLYGWLSPGFYSDDEVNHTLHLNTFWESPGILFNYYVRPGFKLIYLLPGLAGNWGLLVTNALFSAFSCIIAIRIAARIKIPYPELAGIFCASIPIFYFLSFRMYTEIPATLLLVLAAERLIARREISAAFLLSGAFLIRQDLAIFAVILGAWFLYRRNWRGILTLGWAPVALGIAGAFYSGNILWVWDEYVKVFLEPGTTWPGTSLFHALGYIFGSLTIVSAFVGWAWGCKFLNIQRFPFMVLTIFLAVFLAFQMTLAYGWISSPSPGWWRFLYPMAPFVAIFAAAGTSILVRHNWWKSWHVPAALAAGLAFVALFFSFKHNWHNIWFDGWREQPLIIALSFVVLIVLLRFFRTGEKWMVPLVGLLLMLNTIHHIPPKKATPEQEMMEKVANYALKNASPDTPISINHPYFFYYSGLTYSPKNSRYPKLNKENLRQLPSGAWVIWDSHYGYGKYTQRGIPEEALAPFDLKLIQEFRSGSGTPQEFYARIYEKLGND